MRQRGKRCRGRKEGRKEDTDENLVSMKVRWSSKKFSAAFFFRSTLRSRETLEKRSRSLENSPKKIGRTAISYVSANSFGFNKNSSAPKTALSHVIPETHRNPQRSNTRKELQLILQAYFCFGLCVGSVDRASAAAATRLAWLGWLTVLWPKTLADFGPPYHKSSSWLLSSPSHLYPPDRRHGHCR